MNKIKKYFKDYGATWKVCNQFNKEHWFGNIVFGAAIFGAEMGVIYVIDHKDEICDRIREKRAARKGKREMD